MSKARVYKPSHLKMLFARSGNQCAMPECKNNLINEHNDTVVGKICHIEAANSKGPRYNANMSDEQRRDITNLILLCSDHHDEIDNKANVKVYTVKRLKDIKEAHEAKHGNYPYVIKKHHLDQLQQGLDELHENLDNTKKIVTQSQEVLDEVHKNTAECLERVEELATLLTNNGGANAQQEIDSYKAQFGMFDWLTGRQINTFAQIIKEHCDHVENKRKSFIFTQNLILAVFKLTKLGEIITSWNQNSKSPERLDHLQFIQCGIMAHGCLEQIPKDILEDVRLFKQIFIHPLYFNGYLRTFVLELQEAKALGIDLIEHYQQDAYLFENLTRIFSSLKRFLEINVEDIYPDKKAAHIVENLPQEFLLLTTSEGVSVRHLHECDKVFANLPAHPSFPIKDSQIVTSRGKTIIISFDARRCFYWDPEQDLVESTFFKTPAGEEIRDIFCDVSANGAINCFVQLERQLTQFVDFKQTQSVNLPKAFVLSRHQNGFVGLDRSALPKQPFLWFIDESFKLKQVLTCQQLYTIIVNSHEVQQWHKEKLAQPYTLLHWRNENYNPHVQSLNHLAKDVILIRTKVYFCSVLIFLKVSDGMYEVINIFRLHKAVSISVDATPHHDNIMLCCGYLNMNDNNVSCDFIELEDFRPINITSVQNRSSNITKISDVHQVQLANSNEVYLNEMNNKLIRYNCSDNTFVEYSFEHEELYKITLSTHPT
ncbi:MULTISPECIES: hypothetical protein [Pseudoalteromonas]|uniref:Uncharacterized protein n=1 Tax=Pseudoalteromonas amylolytica TaxID=1859457 RepID=A0A1S1MTF3_9GAMM|nr:MULTISPECIES: hypothetical protein [Pseudoalteromonas]OHU84917.1 hypothetical protein BFC16_19705 [Pseudoalteromonas sp. JW3]OHU90132.1 hypothetical protein BET10_15270 [Pseudoalteromonas amylolytica]